MNKTPKMKPSDSESELSERLSLLPNDAELAELCTLLPESTLRELSVAVIKGSIDYLSDPTYRLEYAELLGSWIATAEETLAAGERAERIAARRKGLNTSLAKNAS